MNITLNYSKEELMEEFFWFLDHKGECVLRSNHNKIIKFFQQNNIYKKEFELLNDEKILNKLIINRKKYLKKDDITLSELLEGFKKSGIYYGYSFFNPLLTKWFYEQYNCKISYDPCGGWGHRMLGASELDKYIYNDKSTSVYNSINIMKKFFDINNIETYNNDCTMWCPKDFDSIFTCPPYYNVEHYECGDFKNFEEFKAFLHKIYEDYKNTSTCKVMGLVLRDDLLVDNDYIKKIPLKVKTAKHFHSNNNIKNGESLYIWKK